MRFRSKKASAASTSKARAAPRKRTPRKTGPRSPIPRELQRQIPVTVDVSAALVPTGPKWFRSRYVPRVEDHDPERAAKIVRTFYPQRFEALWVARDPR